jgi:hypothetical protein
MFVFNRSLAAVLLPLALLLAVVFWSNVDDLAPARETQVAEKPAAKDRAPQPVTLTASNDRGAAAR